MSFILNPSRFSTGGADPGLTLLQSATLWLDASDMASGAQWLRNKGTGGRALDARVGSVGSAQIINGALKLNGVIGNYASAPWSSALEITGDIDIRVCATPPNWQAANTGSAATREGNGSAGNRAWALWAIEQTPQWSFWNAAGVQQDRNATTAVPFTGSTMGWVRVTLDVDNGAGGHDVTWYTSTDGTSWTQLGSTITTAGTTSIDATTTSLLLIGATRAGLTPHTGSIHRLQVRNGINGTVAFDADFTAQSTLATSFTESSSNAATVTINSTSGVDTNDPLLLPHTGTNYLYLPGLANNFASVPDSAAISSTTTYEMMARVAFADYSTDNSFVVKRGTSPDRDYQWDTTANTIRFIGFNGSVVSRSVSISGLFTNGTPYWFRVVADGSGTTFYYAADSSAVPSSWTTIGTSQASVGGFVDGTADLAIGGQASIGTWYAGSYYRFILRTTVGGANQLDIDFTANTNQSSFTESSSNAATVTINRSTSGRKAVMVVRPTLLFGTDDYLELGNASFLNFNATDDFTLMFVARRWSNGGSYKMVLRKYSGSTDGYAFMYDNSIGNYLFVLNDGADADSVGRATPSTTLGTMETITATVNRTVGNVAQAFVGTTASATSSLATIGTLSASAALRISTDSDIEIIDVMVWRSVLTSSEIGQIMTYLGV